MNTETASSSGNWIRFFSNSQAEPGCGRGRARLRATRSSKPAWTAGYGASSGVRQDRAPPCRGGMAVLPPHGRWRIWLFFRCLLPSNFFLILFWFSSSNSFLVFPFLSINSPPLIPAPFPTSPAGILGSFSFRLIPSFNLVSQQFNSWVPLLVVPYQLVIT